MPNTLQARHRFSASEIGPIVSAFLLFGVLVFGVYQYTRLETRPTSIVARHPSPTQPHVIDDTALAINLDLSSQLRPRFRIEDPNVSLRHAIDQSDPANTRR